jgi:proprotein convertase subtilisin/kexin type 2
LWDSVSGTVSNFDLFDAMTRHSSDVAVSNNSWGSVDNLGEVEPPTDNFWHQGIASGIANGRNGKGTIYVWAAGNGTENLGGLIGQDNSNYDFQANNRHVIAVCAVDGRGKRASYSEPGANIWLCAPGGPAGSTGLATTDLMGATGVNDQYRHPNVTDEYADKAYTKNFLGTSASTPIVSGVVALMLEANPDLGWRDVRLILAETARMNDPNHSGWSLTSPASNQPQYHINHNYGFGVVDAEAAVARAQTWLNVSNQRVINKPVDIVEDIPDNNSTGIQQSILLDAANDELIVEYVEVDFTSDHQYSGDLEIVLTAPSGTQSILAESHDCLYTFPDPLNPNGITYLKQQGTCVYKYNPWTFGSARHLGESSKGTWVLSVADNGNTGAVGKLLSWTLRIYGRAL